MIVTRRKFLTISAACLMAGAPAQAATWAGRAFGGDVSLTLKGPRDVTGPALAAAQQTMREVEALFSLFDDASTLRQLNRTGHLKDPDPRFLDLMHIADRCWRRTDGLFDPTVQPLWRALAIGHDTTAARTALGWDRIQFDRRAIRLDQGQALTFNGIAQGFATDLVTEALMAHGLQNILVNMGEYRGAGGPWRLGLSDPHHGLLGQRVLRTGAIATSSPTAMMLGSEAHILHPSAKPVWSTVSVEAPTAAEADALSTALVLAPLEQVAGIKARSGITRVTLVDHDGNLRTL